MREGLYLLWAFYGQEERRKFRQCGHVVDKEESIFGDFCAVFYGRPQFHPSSKISTGMMAKTSALQLAVNLVLIPRRVSQKSLMGIKP